MKRIFNLLLCLFLVLTNFNIVVKAEEETIVYVDPTGETEGAYERVDLASEALPNGGTIVVVADAQTTANTSTGYKPSANGKIKIVGANPDIKLSLMRTVIPSCDFEIDNITLVNKASSAYDFIYANGYNLTIGENVKNEKNNSTGRFTSVFCGTPLTAITANNSVKVYSGTWNIFFCGNNAGTKAFNGNTNVEIKNATFNKFNFQGNTGVSNASVVASFENANIDIVQKTANHKGTYDLTIKGGTYNSFIDVVPSIDLSNNSTITLNSSITADSIVGGGTLNLEDGSAVIANDLSGDLNLNIANPTLGNTYLTINNINATGNVNYNAIGNETLKKVVGDNIIYYSVEEAEQEPVIEDVVYLDPAGTSNHSTKYTTLLDAANALPNEGGTIVVCSDFTIASSVLELPAKPIRITGENADARITQTKAIRVSDSLTIDNITWVAGASGTGVYIYARGNDLTFGENVTSVPFGSGYCLIFAGSPAANVANANNTITIKSGIFNSLYCGSHTGSYTGNLVINLEGGKLMNNMFLTGFGAKGSFNGTVNVYVKGCDVAKITKEQTAGNLKGSSNISLESGSVGTFVNVVPSIDLSAGGTLTVNSSIEVDRIIGGGKLILGSGSAIDSQNFTGNIDLEINKPTNNFTYLTIADTNSTGTVNYLVSDKETLNKIVNDNNIEYTIANDIKTHVVIKYYNPDGADEKQPNILLYKRYSADPNKVKIEDYDSGVFDEYKKYIELDLDPGLYYFLVYYNSANDYVKKNFYITGSEENDVVYDFPFIPYTADNHEEATVALPTDQITDNFWSVDKLNIADFDLITPTFTLEKYTRNIRAFMNNDDMCAFIDNLSSPYLHVYYPFELSPMGNKSPVLVFTKDAVDANISIEDLAAEVNSKGPREIFMINGGQHGNEPSGMEGSLQLAYDLCGEYGEEVLDNFGAIVIFPCVSVDNTQRFKREYADGCNSNRDMLHLEHEGSRNFADLYNMFMPTVFVSAHEDNEQNTIDLTDNSIANMRGMSLSLFATTPNIPLLDTEGIINGTYSINEDSDEAMLQRLIDKACAQGFRCAHYPNIRPGVNAEKSYAMVRGSYAFTLEVQRIWSGKNNYDYSVKSTIVMLKNMIEEVINVDANNEKTLAQKVYEAREATKVKEYSEDRLFATKLTATIGGSDSYPTVYVDGTYKDANATKTWKQYNAAAEYRTMPLSYVIPADLEHIDEIINLLDLHQIAYSFIPAGTTKTLKEYSISDTNGDRKMVNATLGENAAVTFENGAYEISLDTSDAYLIAHIFEPDTDNNSTELYQSNLYKMSLIDTSDHLYRYETDEIPTGEPSDVTFMFDGVVYETINDVAYNSLIEAPINNPTKDGCIFEAWYKDINCTNKWNFTKDRITEDTVLYAGFIEGHKITVINAGYGTAHNTTESSSWASTTGGEVHENYVTTVGDFSNTSGAALSIYTDLSDVTAIKFKVGNNEEVVLDYAGKTMTRYLKANNTITSTGNAQTDIVKIAVNASTSTLTSTRFYNITDDITITFVHNTYTMNYLDENNLTKSFEYDSLVNGYVPSGYSYEVAQTSLSSKTAGKYANMHIEVDNTVKGLLVSNGTSEITFLSDDSHIVDTTFGNIEINYNDGVYDVSIINLNSNVTVSPVTNIAGHHISIINAGQTNSNVAIESTNWESLTGGSFNASGVLTTLDDYAIQEGLPVRIYTSIGKLKAITITEDVFSHTFNTNNLQIDIDQYLNDSKYRIVREKDSKYFDVYFYEIKGDIQINIEYDDVIIDFADPYSSAKSYNRNEYPNNAEVSIYDDSIIVNSLDLNNTKAGSVQIGIVPNNDKMSGIIITDGVREVVYEQANNGSGPTDYTFGKMVLAKASGYYFVRFYYLNTDVTIKPKTIDTVSAFQKATLNADGTTSLNLSLKVSPSVNVEDAFLRIDGNDIPLSSLNKNIDGTDNITYSYVFDNIPAKQMGEEHTVQFFKNSEEAFINENTISIRNYLGQIENSEQYSDELKDFAKAMSDYSNFVQNYFRYDKDNIGELDESAIENVVADETNNHVIAGTTEGISAYGQSLTLNYYTDFRVYFLLDGSHSINEYVFKDGDKILSARRHNDTTYYVTISNLAAPDLATKHDITVTLANEGELCVSVSAMSYANLIINDPNEDANLIKAMKAMYKYNQSATALKNDAVSKVSSLDDITPYNGQKVKIAFIGDSITYGYKASDPSIKSYPAAFNTLFNERYEVGNYGVSAAYTIAADSPYNYRASTPKLSYKNTKRYEPSIDFDPDVVLIMLGTNDIRSLLSYGENGVEAYKNALKDLVRDYQALDSVSKVYIVSSVVINKDNDLGLYSKGDLQNIQSSVANELGIDYIDVYTATKDVFLNNPATYYYTDNIHLTDAGYNLIAQTLFNYFVEQ